MPYLRLKNSKRTSKCQTSSGNLYSTRIFLKVSQCRGKKGGTLWDFSTSILSQNSKIEGGPFGEIFFPKKVAMPKKTGRGISSGIVCYAGNLFGSVPWANRGNLKFVELLVELFWSLQVYQKKFKQAGTGPSRRHIQGSKIAKRLPSVKYSFTVLENRNFLKKNFWKKYILKKMDRVS